MMSTVDTFRNGATVRGEPKQDRLVHWLSNEETIARLVFVAKLYITNNKLNVTFNVILLNMISFGDLLGTETVLTLSQFTPKGWTGYQQGTKVRNQEEIISHVCRIRQI